MGKLIRLSLSVLRTSIGVMLVATIAVYVFHLNDWTILGVRIYSILVFSVLAALLNALLQDLIFFPGLSKQTASIAKQTIMLSDDGTIPAGHISFANEVINALDKRERIACRISAVLGVFCYFTLGPRVGSPISEYLTLAVLLYLPLLLLIPMQGPLKRMEALEPSIYAMANGLYTVIHGSIMRGTTE